MVSTAFKSAPFFSAEMVFSRFPIRGAENKSSGARVNWGWAGMEGVKNNGLERGGWTEMRAARKKERVEMREATPGASLSVYPRGSPNTMQTQRGGMGGRSPQPFRSSAGEKRAQRSLNQQRAPPARVLQVPEADQSTRPEE